MYDAGVLKLQACVVVGELGEVDEQGGHADVAMLVKHGIPSLNECLLRSPKMLRTWQTILSC